MHYAHAEVSTQATLTLTLTLTLSTASVAAPPLQLVRSLLLCAADVNAPSAEGENGAPAGGGLPLPPPQILRALADAAPSCSVWRNDSDVKAQEGISPPQGGISPPQGRVSPPHGPPPLTWLRYPQLQVEVLSHSPHSPHMSHPVSMIYQRGFFYSGFCSSATLSPPTPKETRKA